MISACLAYAYDVPPTACLKQGTRPPCGILLPELDIHIDTLHRAINDFGRTTTDALEGAADLTSLTPDDAGDVDVMPRDEVFLISSFMLNLRQAATRTLEMLDHARHLVELRTDRRDRRRLWFPRVKLRKWLFSGTEQRDVFPANAVDSDCNASRETLAREHRRAAQRAKTVRERIADFLAWVACSEDVLYAFKLTVGVMVCSWPAFVEGWALWFYYSRGVWVGLVFILVFENAVGSTIWIFALRAVGTVVGSVWGYAAYKARGGNVVVIAVIIMLGTVPSYYVQLGTKYVKAGMICTISMCVVAVSTHLQTVPGQFSSDSPDTAILTAVYTGSPEENFYKRTVTMLIGGCVATLVQMIILPAKARVKLKESLAAAIVQITKMESCIALGVDETKNIVSSPRLFKKFARAHRKAEAALASAETFLEYTRQEPRLKGDFEMQAVVYKEVHTNPPTQKPKNHKLTQTRREDHIRPPPDCRPHGKPAPDAPGVRLRGPRAVQRARLRLPPQRRGPHHTDAVRVPRSTNNQAAATAVPALGAHRTRAHGRARAADSHRRGRRAVARAAGTQYRGAGQASRAAPQVLVLERGHGGARGVYRIYRGAS